ncbi:MAG TPA: hypothetical protein VGP72_21760 [Planctomycetota bacterium]|jgi:chromosome segregation ATPase
MADEPTVKYQHGGALQPAAAPSPTFMQALVIGIPAAVLALLIAVGVSYAILNSVNTSTKEEVTKAYKDAIAEQDRQTVEKFKAAEAENAKLKKEIADTNEKIKALDDAKEKVTKSLESVAKGLTEVTTTFKSFEEGQKTMDKTQNQDIAKNAADIHTVETKVKYVEDRLKKLDDLDAAVNGLKNDTTNLKGECAALRKDVVGLGDRQKVTEQDLTDLDNRARMFQLRVLAARAREAALDARKLDLKNLLSKLDDVEDKK